MDGLFLRGLLPPGEEVAQADAERQPEPLRRALGGGGPGGEGREARNPSTLRETVMENGTFCCELLKVYEI